MPVESYGSYWDEFYRQNYRHTAGGKALWDVPVERSLEQDIPLFESAFSKEIPVLDIGCGTGEIAHYLAINGFKVIGVDVAREAIQLAKEQFSHDNLRFQAIDFTNKDQCQELMERTGPVNIYVRGVMHQIKPEDLQGYIDNIEVMLADRGYLYMIEVGSGIRDHFLNHSEVFHKLPKSIQQVFISNLPPRGITTDDVAQFFHADRFKVIFCNDTNLETNLSTPDGSRIRIPAVHALIRTHSILE